MKNNLHAKGEYQMKFEEINRLCTQALDLSLGLQESSYSNAFSVVSGNSGITIIPRLPATFIINKSLFEKIYEILSVLLYPNYTLLKQSGMNLIPLETGDIHTQRGLFFPWQKGTVQRLEIDDIETFLSENKIPDSLAIKYLKVIYKYLKEEEGQTYGSYIRPTNEKANICVE